MAFVTPKPTAMAALVRNNLTTEASMPLPLPPHHQAITLLAHVVRKLQFWKQVPPPPAPARQIYHAPTPTIPVTEPFAAGTLTWTLLVAALLLFSVLACLLLYLRAPKPVSRTDQAEAEADHQLSESTNDPPIVLPVPIYIVEPHRTSLPTDRDLLWLSKLLVTFTLIGYFTLNANLQDNLVEEKRKSVEYEKAAWTLEGLLERAIKNVQRLLSKIKSLKDRQVKEQDRLAELEDQKKKLEGSLATETRLFTELRRLNAQLVDRMTKDKLKAGEVQDRLKEEKRNYAELRDEVITVVEALEIHAERTIEHMWAYVVYFWMKAKGQGAGPPVGTGAEARESSTPSHQPASEPTSTAKPAPEPAPEPEPEPEPAAPSGESAGEGGEEEKKKRRRRKKRSHVGIPHKDRPKKEAGVGAKEGASTAGA